MADRPIENQAHRSRTRDAWKIDCCITIPTIGDSAIDRLHLRPPRFDEYGSTLPVGKGADMTDKSPRKTASKKSGKSLKEKRQAKKDKEQTRKGLTR